ncbi:hypothetical protein [Segetibacter koreensis]|nr:hypothetical protein [Segetibacter koreensis]
MSEILNRMSMRRTRQLIQEGKVITTETLKNKLLGKKDPIQQLLKLFLI